MTQIQIYEISDNVEIRNLDGALVAKLKKGAIVIIRRGCETMIDLTTETVTVTHTSISSHDIQNIT